MKSDKYEKEKEITDLKSRLYRLSEKKIKLEDKLNTYEEEYEDMSNQI